MASSPSAVENRRAPGEEKEAEGPLFPELVGAAPPSPAGPIDAAELATLASAPSIPLPKLAQTARFSMRQIEFVFKARRELGEVFRMRGVIPGGPVITSHPDHVKSLFTAKPEQAPSLTGESPLRPILGPNSVLTATGPRHMRQRKLLLPPFHGEAIAQYVEMITAAAEREIDRWPVGETIALAPRMQAITLDVIMAGIFGVEGRPAPGTPEHALRREVRKAVNASTWPTSQLTELLHVGREEAMGPLKYGLRMLDRPIYAVIRERRRVTDLDERRDILSILLRARTEDGETMDDKELRDELLTLVLAGHETTANSLAWAWERLTRNPEPHAALVEAVRRGTGVAGETAAERVEATIVETMRNRPVIPIIGRRVQVPWRLGDYGVEPGTAIAMSILLVHHREDVYPDPFAFRPERWLGRKPGTYDWIPFGGGIRRCLGAALAMAEQRVVLTTMARRLDLAPDREPPERAMHRNVTMIPARGARVVIAAKH
ncbi:MAG TPA: cytochrome P450 [Solirubrobacterales bacterium]|nr:cytochrome P450 [Solirubrobacterales bacterium]